MRDVPRSRILLGTLLVATMACHTSPKPGSDGGSGNDAGPTSACPDGVVCGVAINHYVTDRGIVDRAVDFSTNPPSAWVLEGGTFIAYAGQGTSSGTFTIPGVPPGEFTLVASPGTPSPTYVVSSLRWFDLGASVVGRPDVALADAGTLLNVAISVDGLGQGISDVLLWSTGAGGGTSFGAGSTGCSSVPEYSLCTDGGDGEWGLVYYGDPGLYSSPLIEGSKGDILTVYGQTYLPGTGGLNFFVIASGGFSTSLDVADGTTTPLVGVFDAGTPQTFSQVLHMGSFVDAGATMNPALNPSSPMTFDIYQLFVTALPGGNPDAGLLPGAQLLASQGFGTTDLPVDVTWFSPFPAGTPVFVQASLVLGASFPMGDAGLTGAIFGTVLTADAMETFSQTSGTPPIGSPHSLVVQGMNGYGNLNGIGTTPSLEWSPPASGVPSYYVVSVGLEEPNPGRGTSVPTIASLLTTDTHLTVPPMIMDAGSYYAVQVCSVLAPNDSVQRPLATQTFPYALVCDTTSGFTP